MILATNWAGVLCIAGDLERIKFCSCLIFNDALCDDSVIIKKNNAVDFG